MVDKLVRALALAAGLGHRPGVLQAICQKRLLEPKQFGPGGEPVYSSLPRGVTDALMRLTPELWDAPEDGVMVIELRVTPSGYLQFGYSTDLRSLSPARVVLDHGYRYPGHPLPGMPAPAAAVNTDLPTDPRALDTVSRLVDSYIAVYTEIMDRPPQLPAGYSDADIADAESRMGLRLPADVRALYRTIQHDNAEHGLLGRYCLMPLDQVVQIYLTGAPGSYGWNDDLFSLEPVVLESYPDGRVRRISRSDWWVTIASDYGGSYCAVDLDPAGDGTPGQLIEYGRDIAAPVDYLAPSATALLGQVIEALRAGKFWEPHPEDARLRTNAPVGNLHDRPDHTWSVVVGDRDLATAVAELDDKLAVQSAHLNDGNDLDLAALAPMRNLRMVSVNRAGRVRSALPAHLPIESLCLDTASADLEPLAGHPTLWDLTIRGAAEPVEVRLLANLPALARLDLSAVTVRNEAQLARLTELRVITLNHLQWSHLRQADQIPTQLAAAELCGYTALAYAVDWANSLPNRQATTAAPVRTTTIQVRQ